MDRRSCTWYVYLLRCADGTLYTGITLDPQRRLRQHNAGRGARYTRTRLPVQLVGSIPVQGWGPALQLEGHIKGWGVRRKQAFFAEGQT
ncbi:MAG: GIY-YIG nuclease family protein [Chloroflexi bacterium]|nr:GIY-YIG nuclease family protein [Chloroflexota bacterium]